MPANPLLVVHGVGNRSENVFKETTRYLQERTAGKHQLIHVFWGDLGGISEGLETTLPDIFPGAGESEYLTRALIEPAMASDEDEAAAIISNRATGQSVTAGHSVRSNDETDAIRESIVEAVAQSRYIKTVGDVEVLNSIGDLVAAAVAESGELTGNSGFEVRAWSDGLVGSIMKAADAMIGKITGNLGGTFNQLLRKKMAVPIALTFGDVVAYHQNRNAIHDRLFECLKREAPGWGTKEKPVNVMAHSLGGLVVLDAALTAEGQTLWINRLVTFGSQPAFFHVLAPRKDLDRFEKGKPVTLPGTIKHWTNLWHRLDVLAFTAKPVFRLEDGTAPIEVDVGTTASEIMTLKGWLHSCYWESGELLDAWR
jgi:hypothetical protein